VKGIDFRNSDFFSFWLAGHLVLTGQNPYFVNDWVQGHNIYGATWISDSSFLYPLPLALFYAPLGLLSLFNAYIVWVFLLEVMIIFSVLALIFLQTNPERIHYIFPIFAGVTLFRPSLNTLFGGQISGLLLLILTCVVLLWSKEKWSIGALLLPLVVLKPNIGGPILIILIFWLLLQKRVKAFIGIAISSLVLIFIGMIIYPNWILNYLEIGNTKMTQTFGFSPTLWGLSAYITNFKFLPTIILGGITITILLIGIFWFNR
jgi:hypothetical protein